LLKVKYIELISKLQFEHYFYSFGQIDCGFWATEHSVAFHLRSGSAFAECAM